MSVSKKELPKFSVALVNYKTLDLTKACLTLLKKHLDQGAVNKDCVDVWVVDNDSKDESTEYLRTLDWINLIERKVTEKEEGFVAHGKGLDLILKELKTDYLFLMHTDTLIYDPNIFRLFLEYCQQNPKIAAVGCLHQINRGYFRTAWRTFIGFFKFYSRRCKLAIGLTARTPKPYLEPYIKSFFALWNIKLMRDYGLTFLMENRIPGYQLQDIFKERDYKIQKISPIKLFKYLDHVEAGTVGIVTGYSDKNRRVLRKKKLLKNLES